jgi:glycine/D-amino acid oxidase-like deaminating enzyme
MRQPEWSLGWLARVRPSLPLHLEAARLWRSLEKDLGADLGLRFGVELMVAVAETGEEFERLREKARLEREIGLGTQLLSESEVRSLNPRLSSDLVGADYCPDEGHANPLLAATAFLRGAVRAGGRVRARCRVEAIEPARAGKLSPRHDGGPDSSGPRRRRRGGWTAPVTRMLGIRLPVVGSVLQVVVTESRPAVLPQLV